MTARTDVPLDTEGRNAASADIDCLSAREIVRLMNREDATVAAAVAREMPAIARSIEEISVRLERGGRLIYVGAGTSGRLGVLDAAECPPTFSTPAGMVIGLIAGGERALIDAVEEVEDDPAAGRTDLEQVRINATDAVVGITTSGRTPYVLGALECAGEHRALRVGLTCNRGTRVEDVVDILIAPVVGPEVLTGSTRLKAGTAEKMVLNMLSTGVMILLGKTFGNLMVDLRTSNSKLRGRAVRIVQAATGLSEEQSAAGLSDADGEVKTAIVAALAEVGVDEARRHLAGCSGRVRSALAMLEG